MSVTINNITYSRINKTLTARVGDGTKTRSNAVSTKYEGELYIMSSVQIDGVYCIVTEIGYNAICDCTKITKIFVPNTIKKLREHSFDNLPSLETIVIPFSVIEVETFFIANMGQLQNLTFCGTNDPKMINTREDTYVSNYYIGDVSVPNNYKLSKTTFLKRNINRTILTCAVMR